MGEVYRATDTKLKRDVAIKVLPDDVAGDNERLARFEREAHVLASLNHPHIASIYGLEESGGVPCLVLELVEGPTLAERLVAGSVALEEALEIARQITSALEAAHEKGVIHRDLKPANIKITPEGQVKILDFGLAKALADESTGISADPSQSPTLTISATRAGVILGTAAYMSPEQARGRHVDKRTDIWAFGCVFYELLSGRPAFGGDTVSDTLAEVLKGEPDWTQLPPGTPSRLHRLLRRCVEKNPKRRMRDIGDVALDLIDAPAEPAAPVEAPHGLRWRIVVPLVLLLALISYFAGMKRSPPTTGSREWVGERLGGPTVATTPAISPDGSRVAFLTMDRGLTQVAVMQPGAGSRQLTHDRTRGQAWHVAWDANSSRIYYTRSHSRESGIFSVTEADGGAEERLVLEDAADPRPLPDGSLLAVRTNSERLRQLMRFTPATNAIETMPVLLPKALTHQAIKVLPGGFEAVVVGRPLGAPESENHLHVVDLATGAMRRIAPDVTLPPFEWLFPLSATSDEAYFVLTAGNLYRIVAVPLDGSSGVRPVLSLTRMTLAIDIADDGALYLDQIERPPEIVRMDPRTHRVERFPLSVFPLYILPLEEDRFLISTRVGGRDQLMVVTPDGVPVPFL
ncbi:MAG: protein kinase domain-containing protein, partial [Planctomycetota bacterium]